VLFHTHVTDRFTPFHSKVIAANASEAAHVLDGLLDHESELVIREHATDTAGPVNVRAIEAHWDETLRLAASIRAATVSASIMLRKLVGFPRQNPVAREFTR
jgi:TnpA family transposase